MFYLQQEDMSVQLEALDILGDLLSRFGGKITCEMLDHGN